MPEGTIKKRKDERGVYYQLYLPRRLSVPPDDCKDPDNYQQAVAAGERIRNKDEARRTLDDIVSLLATGQSVQTQGLTTGDAYKLHLQQLVRQKTAERGTPSKARQLLRGHYSFARVQGPEAHFWDLPYHLVEFGDVKAYVVKLQNEVTNKNDEPLSASTIRGIVSKLKAMFEYMQVEPNPCLGQKLPAKSRPVITYLTLAEQKRLLGSEDVPLKDRVMLGCLMSSGIRIGEFLSIEDDHVDVDSPAPHLHLHWGGDGHDNLKGRQTGETRRVELIEPGLSFWRFWMEHCYDRKHRMVFAGRNGGYQKHWTDQLPDIGAKVLGKRLHAHLLRHTYAMSIINRWWGGRELRNILPFVQMQMGHNEFATTERHYGRQLSAARQAAELRGDIIPETAPLKAGNFVPEISEASRASVLSLFAGKKAH